MSAQNRSIFRHLIAAIADAGYFVRMNRIGCYRFIKTAIALPLVALLAGACAVSADQSGVEFADETQALVAATSALFDAIESAPSGDFPQIRIEGLAVPASASLDEGVMQAFPSVNGPVQHLTGYRVNWYPVDRLLGAVDFMGTYNRNRGLVCGYVTWDLSDPKTPQIDRLVANYVDLNLLAKRHPGATHAALLDANCAYGEIEPNFTVFDPA